MKPVRIEVATPGYGSLDVEHHPQMVCIRCRLGAVAFDLSLRPEAAARAGRHLQDRGEFPACMGPDFVVDLFVPSDVARMLGLALLTRPAWCDPPGGREAESPPRRRRPRKK
ncbi:hypothetical protein [Paludisphaera mucosa]|uniref:Uncharacterized protein n=1 Tax=Paludisphaera mucosa TaxID=3030827 RepID=A0ABT6F6T1_9BACT|nr:hypothetical protein [Paludisphaera mucosa]MDG3003291.1 hypothetical protein [Paludisphaera mucosa]